MLPKGAPAPFQGSHAGVSHLAQLHVQCSAGVGPWEACAGFRRIPRRAVFSYHGLNLLPHGQRRWGGREEGSRRLCLLQGGCE